MLKNPIKRNELLKDLSRVNHFTLVFCWKIRQGLEKEVAVERICKYIQYFWQHHLQSLLLEKEQVLFPLLEGRQLQKAIREYKTIRLRMRELASSSENHKRKQLSEFADLVYELMRYEKRDLFPQLEKKIGKLRLEEIVKRPKRDLFYTDNYIDRFWNIE